MAKARRGWMIAVVVLSLLVLIVVTAASVADEPLRRYVEDKANSMLPGFHVTIGAFDLHPLTLSADLRDVVVRQDIHPDPPVLSIPHVTADAQLAPLFSGQVGADLRVETPAFAINKRHVDGLFRRKDAEAPDDQGEPWQDRLRAATAFRGTFSINNGHLTYDDGKTASEPFQIDRIDVEVQNITNRPEENQEYPSKLRMNAQFPDQSQMGLEGRANLLALPVPRVDADLKVDHLQLKNLLPLAGRYNVQCTTGALDLNGRVKYSTEATVVAINDLRLQDAKIDYVHSAATSKEVQRAKKVADKAKESHNDSTTRVKVEHGKVINSELGFVNMATDPDYRVFVSEMDMDVENLSNRLEEGTGIVKITGKFMGSGLLEANGTFRPEKPRPDFDQSVKIVRTKVESFNNILRAYGDLDTHHGLFAFFSELSVKDNQIRGYVKPLLKDVEAYDPEQDKDKPLAKKIYEAVVGGVLGVLENEPRKEAATTTDLSGPVENPHANTWQIVGKLLQNAFFKAILPGFERVR